MIYYLFLDPCFFSCWSQAVVLKGLSTVDILKTTLHNLKLITLKQLTVLRFSRVQNMKIFT